ncbi:MAG: biotin carboxylase N-terminal domain-containing protein, partial [Planctomycetota bacterium]
MPAVKPFKKLLVANRGEIAIRVLRAASELGLRTVAVYTHEDRFALHRFKADESYLLGPADGGTPVKGYLDIDGLMELCRDVGVDAVHPGYGFLAENADLARACVENGVAFVGPPADILGKFGDKTEAKKLADKAKVPTIPGSAKGLLKFADVEKAATKVGFPLMLKASFGGGGRGMRIVRSAKELRGKWEEASREAAAAFGRSEVFLERYIEHAKHIEVQILADAHGNLVHLWDRDCSVQRRHQKVVELAPSVSLSKAFREQICNAAADLTRAADYVNAGTVEFLV